LTFLKRQIVSEIEKYLATDDVIVIHGARQVGKTSVMYYIRDGLTKQGETTHYMDLEDSRLVNLLDRGPDEFIKHLKEEGLLPEEGGRKAFVFIDEIQYLSNPSSFIKLVADHHKNIKLIISGSSSFGIKNKFKDSLAGRTVEFELYVLSFREFLLFKGRELAEGAGEFTGIKIEELKNSFKEYALYGGYPKIVLAQELSMKEKYLQQIIDTYIKKDIGDLANIKDIDKFNKLVEALASQGAQLLNVAELSNTTKLAKATVEKYLMILENTYIIRLVRPYSRNLRAELFKLPKIFFHDTGLMQMLWLKGLQKELIGNVFETCIFSELVKKYGKDAVYHWRTADRKEIDFILKRKDAVLPVEVKLNFGQFNPSAVKYFNGKYGLADYKAVSLYGEPSDKFAIYPWEL
jgi:predicted AAA+ superfamily ATPase